MVGTPSNDLNISQAGYVVFDGVSTFTGRTFQAGTGITLTNASGVAGNTTIASTASLTDLHVARFIVASSTAGTGANFTTIASAIAAAQGTGINSTIFIQPGTYTENITLVPGINLVAFDCDSETPNVTIIGKLTLTAAGTVSISGIRLQTNSDFAIVISGTLASQLQLRNCWLNCTNNTGISITSSSAGAGIELDKCRSELTTTGIALFAISGGGSFGASFSILTNNGASLTASTNSAGAITIRHCSLGIPITTSGTAALESDFNLFIMPTNLKVLTIGGSGTNILLNSTFSSGSATAISINAATLMANCVVSSSNASAIDGSSTLSLSGCQFNGSSSTITTTTVTPLNSTTGTLNIKGGLIEKRTSTAISYTVLVTDVIIGVTTNAAARTITMPNAGLVAGQRWTIKDEAGTAGSVNNITISGNGANIDGSASYLISNNYGCVDIYTDGTNFFTA